MHTHVCENMCMNVWCVGVHENVYMSEWVCVPPCLCVSLCVHMHVCVRACVCTDFRRMFSRPGLCRKSLRMSQEKVLEGSEGSCLSDCKFQPCVFNAFYFLCEIHMNT